MEGTWLPGSSSVQTCPGTEAGIANDPLWVGGLAHFRRHGSGSEACGTPPCSKALGVSDAGSSTSLSGSLEATVALTRMTHNLPPAPCGHPTHATWLPFSDQALEPLSFSPDT